MKRTIFLTLTALWLGILITACQSAAEHDTDPAPQPVEPATPTEAATVAPAVPEGPLVIITDDILTDTEVDVVFADNAFPPLLPKDDDHAGAWMRTDCLLCHDNQDKDAPQIQHEGMSSWLLKARCRSCHLPGDVVPEESGRFARR